MLNTKAAGFNMVRFIAGVADPAQLDFCDELGLMVYEECLASWLLVDSPKMAERFDHSTGAMIRRDRNHPCITIWGLLNETENGPVFRQAVAFLLKLKQRFGDRIALIGGMDERILETNDRRAVETELLSKLPGVMAGSGYVLQVDHSVSPLVEYETYKFFVERGLEIGTYRE
jgi:hypothetical protein